MTKAEKVEYLYCRACDELGVDSLTDQEIEKLALLVKMDLNQPGDLIEPAGRDILNVNAM